MITFRQRPNFATINTPLLDSPILRYRDKTLGVWGGKVHIWKHSTRNQFHGIWTWNISPTFSMWGVGSL